MEKSHSDCIQAILKDMSERINSEDGTYIHQDGLKYCSLCHTPRQRVITIADTTMTINCMCECMSDKALAEEQQETERRRRQRIEESRRIGLKGVKYRQMTFSESDEELKREMTYCDKFPTMFQNNAGLMFLGGSGTGKTYRASCIANELIDRGYGVYMDNIVGITNDIQNAPNRQEFISEICNYTLLIIDDLGAERNTDYMREMTYNLIDSRYKSGKPLIITSNLSLEEMKNPAEPATQRTYDRIFEMCSYPIVLTDGSRRRKEGNSKFKMMKELLG